MEITRRLREIGASVIGVLAYGEDTSSMRLKSELYAKKIEAYRVCRSGCNLLISFRFCCMGTNISSHGKIPPFGGMHSLPTSPLVKAGSSSHMLGFRILYSTAKGKKKRPSDDGRGIGVLVCDEDFSLRLW